MSDEDRAPFIGKKVGDTMDVDVDEALSRPRRSALPCCGVKEAELEGIDPKLHV